MCGYWYSRFPIAKTFSSTKNTKMKQKLIDVIRLYKPAVNTLFHSNIYIYIRSRSILAYSVDKKKYDYLVV